MSEDILNVIKERKSVRKYKDKTVEREKVDQLLEAGALAPTAGNCQPWKFIVIKDQAVMQELIDEAISKFNASWLSKGVPLMIAVCGNPAESAARYGDRGRYIYVVQDTAAAIENIMLAATDMGLGTCWLGAFDELKVNDILNIEPEYRTLGIIAAGYPAEEGERPSRKELSKIVEYIE